MRRIINSTFVSVDGVTEHLDRWHFQYHDESATKFAEEQIFACDAMLIGRKTYEVYASAWPSRAGAYADKINNMRKYVVSRTLDEAEWDNSTIIRGGLVETVIQLKQQPGRDILMTGFGPVARLLLQHDLLDEIDLWVHPVFVGSGDPGDILFRAGSAAKLDLIDATALRSGVVILSYRPARQTLRAR